MFARSNAKGGDAMPQLPTGAPPMRALSLAATSQPWQLSNAVDVYLCLRQPRKASMMSREGGDVDGEGVSHRRPVRYPLGFRQVAQVEQQWERGLALIVLSCA